MASFGENLRREREMRGVTLEEISTATKISLRFLQALEREDFNVLPGGIFTRSFIRAYAKYLGMDEEPLLAEYQVTAQPKGDIDFSRLSAAKPLPQREGSRAAVLALLLAAAMLGGSYPLYRYSRRVAEGQQQKAAGPGQLSATPSPAQSQPNQGAAPVQGSPSTQATGPGATPVGAQKPRDAGASPNASGTAASAVAAKAKGQSELTLQVAATERSWVAIAADGKTSFQRILNPDEVKTLKAKESFDVITGNAEGIILTLNGETLKPLGGRNVYKKVHLTHDDLSNPAP